MDEDEARKLLPSFIKVKRMMNSKPLFSKGEKVLVEYRRDVFEAKVLCSAVRDREMKYLVHYLGWSKSWDEWVGSYRLRKMTGKNICVEPKSIKTNEARGKKRMHESSDEEVEDYKRSNTILFYKKCLGMDTILRVLCDSSFVRHLFLVDPRGKAQLRMDIRNLFGVEDVWFCTTSCVYAELLGELEGGDPMEDDLLKFARNMPFQCNHREPVPYKSCIETVIKKAVIQPYFLATWDCSFWQDLQQKTMVPVLPTEQEGRLYISCLTRSEKRRLRGVKKERLFELNRLHKAAQEKIVKEETMEAEQLLHALDATYGSGEDGEITKRKVSERGGEIGERKSKKQHGLDATDGSGEGGEITKRKVSGSGGVGGRQCTRQYGEDGIAYPGVYISPREHVKKKRKRKKKNKSAVVEYYKRVLQEEMAQKEREKRERDRVRSLI